MNEGEGPMSEIVSTDNGAFRPVSGEATGPTGGFEFLEKATKIGAVGLAVVAGAGFMPLSLQFMRFGVPPQFISYDRILRAGILPSIPLVLLAVYVWRHVRRWQRERPQDETPRAWLIWRPLLPFLFLPAVIFLLGLVGILTRAVHDIPRPIPGRPVVPPWGALLIAIVAVMTGALLLRWWSARLVARELLRAEEEWQLGAHVRLRKPLHADLDEEMSELLPSVAPGTPLRWWSWRRWSGAEKFILFLGLTMSFTGIREAQSSLTGFGAMLICGVVLPKMPETTGKGYIYIFLLGPLLFLPMMTMFLRATRDALTLFSADAARALSNMRIAGISALLTVGLILVMLGQKVAEATANGDERTRRRGKVLGFTVLMAYYVAFVSAYSLDGFAHLPQALGGGRPLPVTLWTEPTALPERFWRATPETQAKLVEVSAYLVSADANNLILSSDGRPGSAGFALPRSSARLFSWGPAPGRSPSSPAARSVSLK
jgi:hypothetical protein